jgi:hypothetical protein
MLSKCIVDIDISIVLYFGRMLDHRMIIRKLGYLVRTSTINPVQ